MAYATKDGIAAAHDWEVCEYDVPEWGGVIRLRSLSALERLQLVKQFRDETAQNDNAFMFYATLITMSQVDEHGNQFWRLDNDTATLQSRNWNVLERVARKIMQINGMGNEEQDALEKN